MSVATETDANLDPTASAASPQQPLSMSDLGSKMDSLMSEMLALKTMVSDLATAVAAGKGTSSATVSDVRAKAPLRQRSTIPSFIAPQAKVPGSVPARPASATARPASIRTDSKNAASATASARTSVVAKVSPRGSSLLKALSPGRPASAKDPVSYGSAFRPSSDGGGGGVSAASAGDPTEAALFTLEDKIRDAVRAKGSVQEASKEMLLRLFKGVDDGNDEVNHDEFAQVCAQLGVSISAAEARAVFKRFGYEATMPYQKFATTLLTQPSRALAEELPTRKGAFKAGQSAAFNGKILYDHCRKAVLTPSAWDPALAERSAKLPDAHMELEFVYGYQGAATSQNCFYTASGDIVFFVAALGVVQDKAAVPVQRHFLGHTDDVKSLAVCRAEVEVKGKKHPAGCLIATGQVTSVNGGAYVSVWDSRAATGDADQEVAKLQFDKDARGIVALAFSPDGSRLVCVATDNYHTVHLYDWRANKALGSWKGYQGDPPQVYGVEWNPFELTHAGVPAFLTFGKKHIKMWGATPTGDWAARSLSTSKQAIQNVTSAAWLPPRESGGECLVVAGMADGQLYLFKGGVAIKALPAHQPGPNIMQPDGQPALHGVRGMRLVKDNTVLLTGGADGVILQWDVSDGALVEGRHAAPPLTLVSPFGPAEKPPRVRSLDYSAAGDGAILVGTNTCDVLELSGGKQTVRVSGHVGDVWDVAFHPSKTDVMATVTDAGRLYLMDTAKHALIRSTHLGVKLRAVAFSSAALTPDGAHHIAAAGDKGQIQVLHEGTLQQLHKMHDSKDATSELKYSPDNKYLAAASYDLCVDVYNVSKGYGRVSRCSGHSAVVAGVDWTTDSSILQSHSNDKDLLYWIAKTGKQVPIPPRDLEWATWSSKCGFPVMGIWPADGAASHDDINAVSRSHDGRYLVTADDSGLVKLFNFPCVVDGAPYRTYRGHSSHVLGARFSPDDSKVASVGGHDWAAFQFKFVPGASEPSTASATASAAAEPSPAASAATAAIAGFSSESPVAVAPVASPPPEPLGSVAATPLASAGAVSSGQDVEQPAGAVANGGAVGQEVSETGEAEAAGDRAPA